MDFDPMKLEYQLCFRLYAASRNMTRVYQPLLEQHGLTYPQYILMLILFEHQTMDFKELSRMIDLKTATMTPIVRKLQEMQLIKKEINPLDARKFNVSLTDKGRHMKEELNHVPLDLVNRLNLEKETYFTLAAELDRLIARLTEIQDI